MKKLIFLIAGLMVLSASAFAASTEMNRDESLIYVGVAPFGIDIPTLVTTPLSVGVYLGQNFMVAGEIGFPAKYEFTDSNTNQKATVEYTNFGGYGRWFPGTNSFNLFGGIHQRTLSFSGFAKYTDPATGASLQTFVEAKMAAMVAELGIGNQWISDFGLTFGLDWFALRGVLAQTESVTDSGGYTTLAPAQKNEVLSNMKDVNTALNGLPGLFIMSIGWAF